METLDSLIGSFWWQTSVFWRSILIPNHSVLSTCRTEAPEEAEGVDLLSLIALISLIVYTKSIPPIPVLF